MSKKLLALLLALVMIVGSFTSVLAENATETKKEDKKEPVAAEEKKDEKSEEKKDEKSEEKKEEKTEEKTEEKKEEVKDEALVRAQEVLKKAGIISGYSKDSEDFKAEKNVTRAEFASMIVRALNLEESAKSLATVPTGFKDVPTNLWANGYIAVAKQQGIINGYPNGTFQPNRQISYQDMATMLTIALGKAEVGTVYPAGYIVKAQQLGLFNNVKPLAYTDMATRGDVFKMVYNMITSKEFGQRKILKAIVLENSRVENLAENEVTVEVIDVVQKADWADRSRDKKGDQHKYVLDKDLKLDAEELLGKVVDITVDQNDKIVEVKVDDSYKVIEGAVTEVTRNKIGIDDTNYNVGFDERYDETDERIFRTYLNDKNYAYRDFAQKYTADKAYDFARVTLKNGKVIFIDAYQFDDIAPVTQVKDGAVYYRDDTRKANEFKAAHLGQVRFHDAKGFSVAEVKDIVKDDVIHFYNNYDCAIVRKDAKVVTELVKTHRDVKGREFAVGKDAEYRLKYVDYLRAIYSVEGKYFNVVFGREDLEPIIKDNVTILLGLNNSVQLIESAKAWKDGVNAVKKVHSRGEVELLPPTGEKFWATETRDSKYEDYLVYGSTNNQKLFDFDFDDIVYYAGNDKNEIEKMGVLLKKHYTVEKARFVENQNAAQQQGQPKYIVVKDKVNVGYADNFKRTSLSARYITSGVMNYRYFNNLKAYYLDKDGELQQVGDWDTFYDYNKDNKDLESYVVSELELKNALTKNNVKSYYFLSNANDIASIVIFNRAKDTKYEQKYAVVKDLFRSTNEIGVVDANNNEYIVDLDKKLPANVDERDIVLLNLEKASLAKKEKTVVGHVAKEVIDRGQETVKFEALRPTNTYLVTYNDGRTQEVYFDKDTNEFNRQSTDYAQIYFAKDKDGKDTDFIAVIRYKDEKIGGSEEVGDIRDLGMRTNHTELELDGRFVPVTNRILFKGATKSEYGQKGYFDADIAKYIGGKVKVYTNRYNEIICVEGYKLPSELLVADKVEILNKVKRAIEKLGKVNVPSAKASSEQAYFQAKVDALLTQMNKDLKAAKMIKANVKATVAYASNMFTTTVTYDSPTDTAETAANTAVATKPVEAKNAAKVLTAAEEAKAVNKAIEELAPKYTVYAIYPVAGAYNVNDDDVLAFVKEQLAIAASNSSLANRYSDIQDFDATKLTLKAAPNGVVADKTDATTKAGTYKVTFLYNGTELDAVVFTLGVKSAN